MMPPRYKLSDDTLRAFARAVAACEGGNLSIADLSILVGRAYQDGLEAATEAAPLDHITADRR